LSFADTAWAIDDVAMPAQIWRLQLQSASRSGNGVVDATDLAVTALGTPGAAVDVASGAAVALGAESTFQGSYFGYNVGSVSVPITATGSGGGRSDLIIAQVKDPTFPGSPWQDTDPPWSPQVVSGVTSGTTDVPSGITGVALARIDIPVSTSAITQAMITDLRQMLSPRQQRSIFTGTITGATTYALSSASYATWPTPASWSVYVPPWAGRVIAVATVSGAKCAVGSTFGRIRWNIGGIVSAGAGYDLSVPSGANYDRFTVINADQGAIPSAIRGTTITAAIEGIKSGTDQSLTADANTSMSLDIEFVEAP
jgi:hypothetical protein